MVGFFAKLLGVVIVLSIVLFLGRSLMEDHSANEQIFKGGTTPSPKPEGFYRGTVNGPHFLWIGKTFNADDGTGFNNFNNNSTGVSDTGFPFVTHDARGIRDSALSVLDLDYDLPDNSWWVRRILDEIVQVEPGHYKGKMYLRLIPGYPLTIAFFDLQVPVAQ